MSKSNLQDIISAFLQRNVNELIDQDLIATIARTGKNCSTEDIHRTVRSNGSSLFQLRCEKDGRFFVRIAPQVNGFD